MHSGLAQSHIKQRQVIHQSCMFQRAAERPVYALLPDLLVVPEGVETIIAWTSPVYTLPMGFAMSDIRLVLVMRRF